MGSPSIKSSTTYRRNQNVKSRKFKAFSLNNRNFYESMGFHLTLNVLSRPCFTLVNDDDNEEVKNNDNL